METPYYKMLRAQLSINRYVDTFNYFRQDIERMKRDGYTYNLIRTFIESVFDLTIEDKKSFRDSLRFHLKKWAKTGEKPDKQDKGVFRTEKDMELIGGFPAFLHYDPSKEPKEENGLDRLSRAIEEEEKHGK